MREIGFVPRGMTSIQRRLASFRTERLASFRVAETAVLEGGWLRSARLVGFVPRGWDCGT